MARSEHRRRLDRALHGRLPDVPGGKQRPGEVLALEMATYQEKLSSISCISEVGMTGYLALLPLELIDKGYFYVGARSSITPPL